MWRYFGRKLAVYGLTFVAAVTINWMIPRFMPGDPIRSMIGRSAVNDPEAVASMESYYSELFGLDVPVWQQYLNFWGSLLQGDLGVSVWLFPQPVTEILLGAVPYTVGLLVPAIVLSWIAGNKFGAYAARSKWLDNTILPVGYLLTAMPYMWLGILLAWGLGVVAGILPATGAYSLAVTPSVTWEFALDLLLHWILPFLSLFLVAFGGWAIGMRNMIIYELEADYSGYLQALGAPRTLVRKYAFRNAMLPQITGLALQLGTIVAGALLTEVVFSYPGLGNLILEALNNRDYFLLQGAFLFLILGVLIANFIVDVLYVLVDPRIRVQMQGGA
ncbi:ABC transporter permease [Lipingzhangella sp. LS1_29]|uniref:ABC transporter permease n=1 Tax=Lipingzhangella rawalii TaxID=2055835 RepID=A0ABU2H4B9_9ACTN|nr:ABC transporter permease [Lipingzhangella rawalii]MDS1270136.1 ABC transporter permease [Lipingzhangella rawalii]